MQEKQKVTLYLPPELHRQLKIRAAVESEPMSSLAERAIGFYMTHQSVVDEVESYGQSHRVYSCPVCSSSVVIRDREMEVLHSHPSILTEETLEVEKVTGVNPGTDQKDSEQLVPC